MNSYPAFGFDSSSSSDESFSVVDDDLLHGNFNFTSNNTISNTKHPTNTNAASNRNDKFNLNQIEDLLEWDVNNEESKLYLRSIIIIKLFRISKWCQTQSSLH